MKSISLSQLSIKEPCHADWNAMTGDQSKRFCTGCQKHVHNLDTLTQPQIDALFEESAGKLCVRYTPPAAKILPTPKPLPPAPRRPLLSTLSRIAASILLTSSLAFAGCSRSNPTNSTAPTLVEQFNDWRLNNAPNWINSLANPLFGTSSGATACPPITGALAPAPTTQPQAQGGVALRPLTGEAMPTRTYAVVGDVDSKSTAVMGEPPALPATQPAPTTQPTPAVTGFVGPCDIPNPSPTTQPNPDETIQLMGKPANPLP